jgi:hypothetical protein
MNHVLKAGLCLLLVSCGAAENSRDNGNRGNTTRDTPNAGTEQEFKQLERSMIRRAKGVNRLLYSEVKASLKLNNLPVTYQAIPTPEEVSATAVESIPLERRKTDCGVSKDDKLTIDARIKDCRTKIVQSSSTTWSAFVNGISGEGNWFLVTYIDTKKVWQDSSTGLLWSDVVGTDTFAQALGRDPKDLEKEIVSLCSSLDDNRKPSLGNLPTAQVKWRLPNREEFLQADINGARNVLTDSGNNLWTASFDKQFGGEYKAWAINHKDGILTSTLISEPLDIRCVGVVTE